MSATDTSRALVFRLLATRERDLPAIEAAHRALIADDASLQRRLICWLADQRPLSAHLSVGLAVLSCDPDAEGRALACRLIRRLPMETALDVVEYVRGRRVKRLHYKMARGRFQDEMTAAYRASAASVRAELGLEEEGASFQGGEILVTLGQYDKVQQVLDYLEMPYRVLPCSAVKNLPLRADQVLIVNCPGKFGDPGIAKIRAFVAAGGTLITTDWALKTTLEKAIPRVVVYNGVSTRDDVVKVSWLAPESVYTRGVAVEGHDLRWWLEGSSYPIKILDDRVEVLARSREMGARYKDDPLVVTFRYGEGHVFHLTSHYYLQRTKSEAARKGADAARIAAASSSLRLLGNILTTRLRAAGV